MSRLLEGLWPTVVSPYFSFAHISSFPSFGFVFLVEIFPEPIKIISSLTLFILHMDKTNPVYKHIKVWILVKDVKTLVVYDVE